jgi:hypothetical protein
MTQVQPARPDEHDAAPADTQPPTPPIACSLAAGALGDRVAEWQTVLRTTVTASDRSDPHHLRLHLQPSLDADRIGQLVGLAGREKACCPFFDFSLDIGADTLQLVVRVPTGEEAAAALDAFATLASAPKP